MSEARGGAAETAQKRLELQRLHARVRQLEADLEPPGPGADWPPSGYYTAFHFVAGMVLGFLGAATSLLFNVVGALFFGLHPLQIIRVYLTFPLGAEALSMNSGLALGIGTCLYLATGSLYGIAFHLVLSRWFETAPASRRFTVATAVGLGLWLVNFYGILTWLQPLLFGGRWIVDLVPVWVAASTHLVFAWTMLLAEGWGRFEPYVPPGH